MLPALLALAVASVADTAHLPHRGRLPQPVAALTAPGIVSGAR